MEEQLIKIKIMEENLQNEENSIQVDTCNGVPMPSDGNDYICKDGGWVKVDVPSET